VSETVARVLGAENVGFGVAVDKDQIEQTRLKPSSALVRADIGGDAG